MKEMIELCFLCIHLNFAEIEDNSIQIKKDLETFIYQLRLHAEVAVVEMVYISSLWPSTLPLV